MRWRDQRQSTNVEDRRGIGGRGIAIGGGGIGVILIALAIMLCGGDPSQLLENLPTQTQPPPQTASNSAAPADENRQFVGAVMGSLEDAWRHILPQQGRVRYQDPKLVLFTG